MDLFGLGKVSKHSEALALLVTVYDNVNLAVVRSILEGEGIPFMIKERGSGSSVKIITGYSMFGTDIFVRREDLEAASALIGASDEEYDESGESESDESDESDEEAE